MTPEMQAAVEWVRHLYEQNREPRKHTPPKGSGSHLPCIAGSTTAKPGNSARRSTANG